LDSQEDSATDRIVIPLAEEEAHVDVRPVVRERVLVRKTIETRDAVVERELRDETVHIERVPIGREIETAPEVREENGVLIVPVVEEELVVSTRLILKEELRVHRQETRRTARVPVRLRRELAQVERTQADTTSDERDQAHGTDR
jgi:uncharacterized protein (TIGR02271 family)